VFARCARRWLRRSCDAGKSSSPYLQFNRFPGDSASVVLDDYSSRASYFLTPSLTKESCILKRAPFFSEEAHTCLNPPVKDSHTEKN
jgi:hypothetical protein